MRNSSRHGPGPRGITLIELMAYLALLAIVMNMLSTVLLTSANWARMVRRRTESMTCAVVAADRFKHDVRSATHASLSPSDLLLTYAGTDKTVRYTTDGQGMARCCTARGVGSSRPLQVRTKSVKFGVDNPASARLVTMTIELASGDRHMKRGCILSTSAALRCPSPSKSLDKTP